MKKQLENLLSNLFGIFIIVAICIGAVAALMFAVGFIAGEPAGANMALLGKKILDYGIKIAAVGVLCGLINFYTCGEHELTLKNTDQE
ncbi:hypothetical protein SAMN05660649_03669 [Desulfotomaculum arcticum]|uniref:Uncharacterized protein n=1 Tax=Desulfotruncus arcticus DSM 17038 TaxID=1121424 RepID=A0A1I2WXB0_9FIRM|nr:hypothetical protein [Desulfotruncus arcticus]SFH05974.1 hypothetical protein SAMN05660649_03669 [Desulfotomaculum arcticum] [Desulfotruncus arcticus DSM 17038]